MRHRALLSLVLISTALPALPGAEDGITYGGDQTWAFDYPADGLRDGAALNLRYLNEKVAGEKGFIKASPDGGFLDGAGKPIRFWAINGSHGMKDEEHARSAKFLAKMGVNLVRFHTAICPPDDKSPLDQPNMGEIDAIWRGVAALKKEGIYVIISPFWQLSGHASFGIDGYAGENLWGVQFFNPKLQAAYKAWITRLYGEKNPYTGIRLADDPAVAVIQTNNEDSLLFWTFQGIKEPQKQLLGTQFFAWAAKKHGTAEKALAAWNQPVAGDDAGAKRLGLLETWAINEAPAGKAGRAADQVQFMAETQAGWYREARETYRKLGCKQLINASNWHTADAVRLNDVERWTYTGDEVIAVNKYYAGAHDGENNGWRIDPGHTFTNATGVRDLRGVPTCLKQVAGKPMMITESSWTTPNKYQSEGPFLMAAYQALTGVDCFFWFCQTSPEYDSELAIKFPWQQVNGQHPCMKWSCMIPAMMGAFPANALSYRLGHVKQGKPVVQEVRSLDSLWKRELPLIAEDATFDPNRREGGDAQKAMDANKLTAGVNPLAFFVGPVTVEYGKDAAKTKVEDLGKFIDEGRKAITSNTGEVTMDYGRGVCLVDTAKTKGVSGFLAAAGGTFELDGLRITSTDEYANVVAVAMDDKPLAQSKKVLVQVGTISRPTGWSTEAKDGKSVVTIIGEKPWQVVKSAASITLANGVLKKATALDSAGFPKAALVEASTDGRKLSVKLPPDALYVILE